MTKRQIPPVLAALLAAATLAAAPPEKSSGERVRTIHLVQDDAQDYMVSKIYVLKYVQANDINPFVSGMVKRYNMNSVVNCIEYGNENQQILTVTCPVKMMPYVDDFIAKVDRDVRIDGHTPGDIIRGTGITRAVYQPRYRSGQRLVDIIVNAFINAGPYGSVYGYDRNSNQIYWKDNTSNTQFMFQFLGFLDRPAPQISMSFTLYEVRDSVLRDLGIEYLAWKNGPGLDLFQAGFRAFDLSSGGTAAIQAMSGPVGGFFFAPQFDASFVRLLQQNGHAEITATADLTVSNSDSKEYKLWFNPQLQNITKSDNDRSAVTPSGAASAALPQISMSVSTPIVCLHSGTEIDFEVPNYKPGDYAGIGGTLFCGYTIEAAAAVERNNYGQELIDTTLISGNSSFELNREKILAVWSRSEEVEQVIGVPFLSEIPYLKYLFSTTTTRRDTTRVVLTVRASMLNTARSNVAPGLLKRLK